MAKCRQIGSRNLKVISNLDSNKVSAQDYENIQNDWESSLDNKLVGNCDRRKQNTQFYQIMIFLSI